MHIRNTLIDAAAEGARWAALADNTPAAGVERTHQLVNVALGAGTHPTVEAQYVGDLAKVTVRADVPLFGLFGSFGRIEVSAHATREHL